MDETKEVKKEAPVSAATFTRDQLAESKRFRGFTDVINAFVGEDEKLTLADADKRIKDAMKAKVK